MSALSPAAAPLPPSSLRLQQAPLSENTIFGCVFLCARSRSLPCRPCCVSACSVGGCFGSPGRVCACSCDAVTQRPPPPPVSVSADSTSESVPVITLPANGDDFDNPLPPALQRHRPRGRPPAGHIWDVRHGRYLPVARSASHPSPQLIWAMVSSRVLGPDEPTSIREALSGPFADKWRAAINAELASLRKCKTWVCIRRSEMPPGALPIRAKWVFKLKRDTSGRVVRFKARLVACGYAQKYGS